MKEEIKKERKMRLSLREDLMDQVKDSEDKFLNDKSKARGIIQEHIDKSLNSERRLKKKIKEVELEFVRKNTSKKKAHRLTKMKMNTWKSRATSRLDCLSTVQAEHSEAKDEVIWLLKMIENHKNPSQNIINQTNSRRRGRRIRLKVGQGGKNSPHSLCHIILYNGE
jgi:uncharacterized membrane protein YheB (UPF0754 family)